MSKYVCLPCGFIYDEEVTTEEQVLFDQKPVNWVCPECGAYKFDFDKLEEE